MVAWRIVQTARTHAAHSQPKFKRLRLHRVSPLFHRREAPGLLLKLAPPIASNHSVGELDERL